MAPKTLPRRSDVSENATWDVHSVFLTDATWEAEIDRILDKLPGLERFHGHLGDSPQVLADWLQTATEIQSSLGKVSLYASMQRDVDTADQEATAKFNRAIGLNARVTAAMAFDEPEILNIEADTLKQWMAEEPRLAIYAHYFDRLEKRRAHVRSAEVEELLNQVSDPFRTATTTHGILADADLTFRPVRISDPSAAGSDPAAESIEVAQGSINALLTDPRREVRRAAWESYADAHLATKNTMANCLATGVKQDVFRARARRYGSSLEAALEPNNIPVEVFYNLINAFRQNLPTWHRYWRIRRQALGYEKLQVYDIKAPLTVESPIVPLSQAVEWISEGMRPLGEEYVSILRKGVVEQRWVDVYPNKGKRAGAYSTGLQGTRPFILMSYVDDIFSMSTLAHELGHSLHSYLSRREQPFIYSRYSLFVAEVASNFNQAMVRAYLLNHNYNRDFLISVIEEAMSNFHRYFFIMPTLARFELEIHERVERGDGLTAESLIKLMADLFSEGYGDEVEVDLERVGITWAQFPTHLYANFYVFQYATGISGAHALAQKVLAQGAAAAGDYLAFLKAGGSVYPLEALKMAGVDLTTPEPVEKAFAVLAQMVDRLEALV
ncbi:MAG: oligoendopeptidase F [Chloroflexi bacterium]|nr:oligoendopeptidase F [Chloroflexota bacterium]